MHAERPLGEHARRAARTYGAAADHYGLAALSFWDRFGAATVAGLPLAAGHTVLDLCCGAGASAIPAARSSVLRARLVDVPALLAMARARAAREPANTVFWESVREARAIVVQSVQPLG